MIRSRYESKIYRKAFWEKMPFKSFLPLGISIFFIFSIIGIINDLFSGLEYSLPEVFFHSCSAGFISVGYVYTLIKKKYILFGVIFISQIAYAFIPWQGIFEENVGYFNTNDKMTISGISILISLMLGYIFMIIFISREGIKFAKLRGEVEQAAQMREIIAPPIEYSSGNIEAFGDSYPAMELGGDLIDHYSGNDNEIFYAADVSGHGINAAVLVSMFKGAITNGLQSGKEIDACVNEANKILYALKNRSMFITVAFLKLQNNGMAEVLVAGHLPIIRYSSKTGKIERLATKQLALSLNANFMYQSIEVEFNAGDVFLLLTDGITEAQDQEGNMLGLDLVEKILFDSSRLSSKEIFYAIMNETEQKFGSLDDRSLIVLKIK